MRIELHIGVEHCGADRLQSTLSSKRDQLTAKGIRFAAAPGNKNHTRLWMAVTDPDHVDPLRFHRGYRSEEKQVLLRETLAQELSQEVETHQPQVLILSASQLCWLASTTEVKRLHDLLRPLSDDIRITAHIDDQAHVMARIYPEQVLDGRTATLDQELTLSRRANWWDDALKFSPEITPDSGIFLENQSAPFWLDYQHLTAHWDDVFGAGSLRLRRYSETVFDASHLADEIRQTFGIEAQFGKPVLPKNVPAPSDTWVARSRQFNEVLQKLLETRGLILPRQAWRGFLNDLEVDGPAIDPNQLKPVSRHFAEANEALCTQHPALDGFICASDELSATWEEAETTGGFRASQYLLAYLWRIEKAAKKSPPATTTGSGTEDIPEMSDIHLSDSARAVMPPLAVQNFKKLQGSAFKPHNRMGMVNEAELAAAYDPAPPRVLPDGSSGNVIVGCMKNEAPYILEWVAYHRAIGVDDFLIYTNDCSDGTAEILDRLQALGVLQHRNNDNWSGNSPQQFALDQALNEPVVQRADWIAHIDVDEFINVRCGNGTLDDFFARVPDATNVAMTWRLFGHNGVTALKDDLVIEQFDTCAPKYCPKPHTVWGFKTMFKNIGAYGKISCHRPNKLGEDMEGQVKWVNGSGRDMTKEAVRNGWRNSRKSIGYDLIQLNHYALRSAESFLIKRQRGRALHVDRSIGLNYWIRMDWTDHRDVTIKRNIPRVRAEHDRLLQDETLRDLHIGGLAWHRAKAEELRAMEEFRDLYDQALGIKLTEAERVAYALALDMES